MAVPAEARSAAIPGGIPDFMSPHSKPASATQPDSSTHGSNLYRVAIVGATTLRGKEVAEVLGERNFPSIEIKLLDDDESLGKKMYLSSIKIF